MLTVKSGLDLTWLMNLKMDLICFPIISVALLSTSHKCTHPCLCCSEENHGEEYFGDYEGFWGMRSTSQMPEEDEDGAASS
jgi:hypothetical protein